MRFFPSLLILLTINLSADADLAARLTPLIEEHEGQVSVAVKHLETGESFERDADRPMPTASLIKFPVMVEAYRQLNEGQIDLDELLALKESDKVPGSGILTTHFTPGARLSLRDAIRLMIAFSDNTATNLVLDKIGLGSTSETMHRLGFPETKIHAKVFRGETSLYPERSRQFGLGSTTASETIRLYEMLHQGVLVGDEACAAMLDHLAHCQDKVKLAAMLPAGVKIFHKGGAVNATRTDAGIIHTPKGPFAICVLTTGNKDRSWRDDNEAHVLCARIAREAYDYFAPPAPSDTNDVAFEMKLGAGGELVEALQRTLNARLEPTPDLSVDGDFGPLTQAAVIRFQQQQQLPATGLVNRETWEALGPLLMEESAVAAPQVVNAEVLPREPADGLSGPPFVTCKAWAVADAQTGKLLWSDNEARPLDIASTTKIMTAYVVLSLATRERGLLEEEVVFSQRADATRGSTAGIRAGERLSVRELLFGLLLPSGNDAAIALGEHIGARLEAAEDSTNADALTRFVAEMNSTAQRLGMASTTFKNPHGLTESGHVSSAADLVRLAKAAIELSDFREYVRTRQHGCTLRSEAGYQRDVVWKNTNRLLGTEGYFGLKTGTTTAAGACLVSCGQRGDAELITVVLGSQSSGARYVDTRNLFRWAWQELEHTARQD